jgi:hypothetical protein
MTDTLYARLGGYDAIVAVTENLLSRLTKDPQLGRFWKKRGDDGVRRESSFSSTSCVPLPAVRCSMSAAT